jgi:hypothetical protein
MYWLWQNDSSLLEHISLPLNTTSTPFISNRENVIHLDIPWTDMFGPVKPYLNTIYGLYETSHHHSGRYRRLWVMQSSCVSGQGPTINLSYTLTCNSIYLHSLILLIRCWITRSEETRTFNDETEHKPRSNYYS